MTFDQKINRIQERYDSLSNHRNTPDDDRKWTVEDATLFLVHDVHGVTINAGLAAWVSYRGRSKCWDEIADAAAAFRRIGFGPVAKAIEKLTRIYRENGDAFPDDFEGFGYSDAVWHHTDAIYEALYDYVQFDPCF